MFPNTNRSFGDMFLDESSMMDQDMYNSGMDELQGMPAMPLGFTNSFPPAVDDISNATTDKTPAKKANRKKKWKKPKDMPKRPLSAYNFFFAHERQQMMETANDLEESEKDSDGQSSSMDGEKETTKISGKRKTPMGFAGLARNIAVKWKALDSAEREPFVKQAKIEQERYKKEVGKWKLTQDQKKQEKDDLDDDDEDDDEEEEPEPEPEPKKTKKKGPTAKKTPAESTLKKAAAAQEKLIKDSGPSKDSTGDSVGASTNSLLFSIQASQQQQQRVRQQQLLQRQQQQQLQLQQLQFNAVNSGLGGSLGLTNQIPSAGISSVTLPRPFEGRNSAQSPSTNNDRSVALSNSLFNLISQLDEEDFDFLSSLSNL